MKVYCINLDSRPDRWKKIQSRFNKVCSDSELISGLKISDLKRFSAVTPDDPEATKIGHFGSKKEKACALSHYRVWKKAIDDGCSRVMILEDDVRFHKDFVKIIRQKLEDLTIEDKNWHCLSLNYVSLFINWDGGWEKMKSQTLAGGYILSWKGLQFLTHNFGFTILPSDHMIRCLYLQGHSYGYFPWLCVQDYSDSDIQSLEHFNSMASWFKDIYFPHKQDLYHSDEEINSDVINSEIEVFDKTIHLLNKDGNSML